MGYYKNLEIAMVTEEPDRLLPDLSGDTLVRRRIRKGRRESYRAPNHWVLTNLDFIAVLALIPISFALGVVLTLLAVILNG